MALAGGVSIRPHAAATATSRAASCRRTATARAFDARAAGTVGGSGVALVVLKRLADALADGDTIHAVIRGTAINNDGSRKVGFTAPSVDGQAEVIADALAVADVDPRTIGYVEAHGSGTELGDPIEVAALTQAFGAHGRRAFCAIGSVKTNVGHLDAAAGVGRPHQGHPGPVARRDPAVAALLASPTRASTSRRRPFFVNAALRAWQTADGAPAARRRVARSASAARTRTS